MMLNKIRKNIQVNYNVCDVVHKPTAKQIAFLDEKIMAPTLEDKDEYRLCYRILKAEEAMLRGEWKSMQGYIFGDAETGAIVLQIGKNMIPGPIQYQIAISEIGSRGNAPGWRGGGAEPPNVPQTITAERSGYRRIPGRCGLPSCPLRGRWLRRFR